MALAVPATAGAAELGLTTKSKTATIAGGATRSAEVTCPSAKPLGLGGGVTVDSVGGATTALDSVDTLESRAVGGNRWRVKLRNASSKAARVTVAVTCLPRSFDGHALKLSSTRQQTFGFDAQAPVVKPTTVTCPAGQIPVGPGYQLLSGAGIMADLRPGINTRTNLKPEYPFGLLGEGTARGSLRCLFNTATAPDGDTFGISVRYTGYAVTAKAHAATTYDARCVDGMYAVTTSFRAAMGGLEVVGSRPVNGAWRYRIVNTGDSDVLTRLASVCISKTPTG